MSCQRLPFEPLGPAGPNGFNGSHWHNTSSSASGWHFVSQSALIIESIVSHLNLHVLILPELKQTYLHNNHVIIVVPTSGIIGMVAEPHPLRYISGGGPG